MEKYNATNTMDTRIETNRQALAFASNLIYDLISSLVLDGEDRKAWKLKDALFDELEKQMMNKESIDTVLDELENQSVDDCD